MEGKTVRCACPGGFSLALSLAEGLGKPLSLEVTFIGNAGVVVRGASRAGFVKAEAELRALEKPPFRRTGAGDGVVSARAFWRMLLHTAAALGVMGSLRGFRNQPATF